MHRGASPNENCRAVGGCARRIQICSNDSHFLIHFRIRFRIQRGRTAREVRRLAVKFQCLPNGH